MDLRTEHTELVRRAIKQDEAAFEQLILLHSEQLYRTAYVYVKNEQDALDVVQETVYKAFISIGQVKEPKYFVTWLTKILIRNCYRVLNQQTAVADLIEQIPVKESSREEHLDLIYALSHLRKEYRDVFGALLFSRCPDEGDCFVYRYHLEYGQDIPETWTRRIKKTVGGTRLCRSTIFKRSITRFRYRRPPYRSGFGRE